MPESLLPGVSTSNSIYPLDPVNCPLGFLPQDSQPPVTALAPALATELAAALSLSPPVTILPRWLPPIEPNFESSCQQTIAETDTLLGQDKHDPLVGLSPLSSSSTYTQSSIEACITPSSSPLPRRRTGVSPLGKEGVRKVNDSSQDKATASIFDLDADLSKGGKFYKLPYPSDLRLNQNDRPKLSGFPISSRSLVASNLRTIANNREKFPVNTPGYFSFKAPIKTQRSNVVIPAKRKSPIWLMNVDPDSSNWGKRYPTVAATLEPDAYVPDNFLGVAPAPGVIMEAHTTYAYVVKRSLKGQNGKLLKAARSFKALQNGEKPDAALGGKAKNLYDLLWGVLDHQKVKRKSIAAATVFSTGDVVADLAALSDHVLADYELSIDSLQLQPTTTPDAQYYQFNGVIDLPQFQAGIPPFNLIGGKFRFDANNRLRLQRIEQDVPLVLTLPKTPMPEGGYPLVVYYHGSNGLSTQIVDRGPITTVGGDPAPGLGPAQVLAAEGFATLGMALPLNPERDGGSSNDGYLNPLNLAAYRDTFRQGVIEQRLILEAITNLQVSPDLFSPDLLAGQPIPSLPTGTTDFQIQSDSFFVLGQSHGAQYAAMMGAVEPKVKAIAPTGSGGYWPLLVTESEYSFIAGLLLGANTSLDLLHPALALLSTAWEAAEPIVYMPRVAQRPLPDHPARSVFQPVALGDTQFPTSVFDAVALATGVEQAGAEIWPEMQTVLKFDKLNGIQSYPIANNLVSENGQPYTGVVVQYEGDGIADPHTIFTQLDGVKEQYATFFSSFAATGVAVVPE